MCDRSKVEVLARNLAFEYFRGDSGPYNGITDPKVLADRNWRQWEQTSIRLIEVLDRHE